MKIRVTGLLQNAPPVFISLASTTLLVSPVHLGKRTGVRDGGAAIRLIIGEHALDHCAAEAVSALQRGTSSRLPLFYLAHFPCITDDRVTELATKR